MCPQPPCIRPWANTSVMSEAKSFKETLKEQRALPHPYPNPLYIYPRISIPASLGVRPFHDSSSSSVIGGAPCCPWRNETSRRDRSCADTSVIRSPPLVSSSALNQANAPPSPPPVSSRQPRSRSCPHPLARTSRPLMPS